MTDCHFLDLKGLPQKSNELLTLFKTYTLSISFNEVIKSLKKIPSTFTIITKNHKYKCHLEIIAAVSKLIYKAIQNDPKLNTFTVNEDFDDSKFNQFASFLNGDDIKISDDNRSYFKSIAELFQIDFHFFNPDSQKELSLSRFSRQFHMIIHDIPKTVTIYNNDEKYSVDYLISLTYSQALNEIATLNSNQLEIHLNIQSDISEIAEFLCDNNLNITAENFEIIENCISELKITLINSVLCNIKNNYYFFAQPISTINLYDIILEINDTNADEIQQLLSNSDFYHKPYLHFQLCLALESAYKYRPRFSQNVISLISKLQSESFRKSLLKYLTMRTISCLISVPFLRSIYDEKIISHDELIHLLKFKSKINDKSFYSYTQQRFSVINELTTFFAKEYYDIDKEAFIKLINRKHGFYFRSNHSLNELNQYIDHWDQFDKEVNAHYFQDSLYEAILKDDVDTFQSITALQHDFDYDNKIKPSLFERFPDLMVETSYAAIAAFYGSLKCFRFLILQQADVSKCAKYAVIGGNPEIIRLVKQNNGDFSNTYHIAIKYHRNDIFKWLLMEVGTIKDLYTGDYRSGSSPCIQTSIQSYNNRALLYFYDYGIDNSKNEEEMTLFGTAVHYLNIDAIKILLTTFQVNPNTIDSRVNSPSIYYAASFDCLEAVKLLVEVGKCEIPKKGEFNPLMSASENGFTDIVEYLVPFFLDSIDESYIKAAANDKIKEILLSNKK